jgi:hypothetical protein
MRGESAYLATRTGCVAVIGRMPQFHADKTARLAETDPGFILPTSEIAIREWRATADEDGHYCFAVAL